MSINKLHSGLVEDGNYSKSLPDFLNDYSTPEKQEKLHAGLVEDEEYSGDINSFKNQYFTPVSPGSQEDLTKFSEQYETDKKEKIQEANQWMKNNKDNYNYDSKQE